MVKKTNDVFRVMSWTSALAIAATAVLLFSIHDSRLLFAQQPQAAAGTPLYSVNAKYVNGMAPGYWATVGSGLTLNVSAGTAYCGNPPVPVSYPGGTLTLTASATNYVYLDPANDCAPAAGTSAFKAGEVPIATVATGASSITSVTDARTWFTPQPCVTGATGSLNCSSLGANQNITLTPSGTGATVITNLEDKGGQVFNVKAYGAKGDGTTDDSGAFQAAYNAAVSSGGGTVYIPPSSSCYLFNEPINMTNSTGSVTRGVTILGAANKYVPLGSTTPGVICGNTGGIVFDLTGSNRITFKNVNVTSQSGVSNPSLIGIYAARNSSAAGAQGIRVIDSTFSMVLHTSGTTYSFGAYLYASEEDKFNRDNFTADFPLVVSATNDFSQNSAFITEATGTQSEASGYFNDMELDSSGLGPAAYFSGTGGMALTGHSWNFSHANPYPSGLYSYALELVGSNSSMFIHWRQEGYPGWAYIKISLLNSFLSGTTAPAGSPPSHAIEFGDASGRMLGDTFQILDEYSSPSSNAYYDASSGSPAGVEVLDHVYFYCGNEANCGYIPIGNYVSGGTTAYTADVHYSGTQTNQFPTFTTGGAGILRRLPNSAATISFGSGAPTGPCVTPSLYLRTDGGSGSTLYVCENSTWAAK